MSDPVKHPTPKHLGAAGRALWREIVGEYELRPDELAVLEKAARTADDAARLDAALRDAPLTVSGSMGQERANPLLQEARATRSLLASLLKQLALPDEPVSVAAGGQRNSPATVKAINAARARWGGPRGA